MQEIIVFIALDNYLRFFTANTVVKYYLNILNLNHSGEWFFAIVSTSLVYKNKI
ncbi:hypothetical protein CCYN2B_140084 [Capnocytophaga cynodegmi]|uniref:Uncharacterized protein n=1 Tax=Capnocytophaga cynodegmi TaxID=28189 RepID=A0A0B7H5F9_9FLAO|nr:hypothetical protein CCYN2B_140084 [Capnocytophaga cynodegmi]